MSDDMLDERLREAAAMRANATEPGQLDLGRVSKRAVTMRRQRGGLVAGAAALGLVVVLGGVYLAQVDPPSQRTDVAVDPSGSPPSSSPASTSPSSGPTSGTTAGDPEQQALLAQLQESPAVRSNLVAPPRAGQVVLCGINVQGKDPDHTQLYAVLVCGLYSTGPKAEELSGGRDVVVIDTDGRSGSQLTVEDVEFPGMADREQRIREMFPANLVATMMSPQDVQTSPSPDELLEEAQRTP